MTFYTRKVSRGHFKSHNIIRCLKKYLIESFQVFFYLVKIGVIVQMLSVLMKLGPFLKIFTNILDTLAPVVEIRVKQRTEPFMTSYILGLIRDRDKYSYLYKKHKNQEDSKLFCKLGILVQRKIRKARSSYFQDKIEENR